MSRPADHTGRSLDGGRAPVDGELGFSVENHEHLLDGVVEVVADAGTGRYHAAMQKVELGRHAASIEKRSECHAAGATVHGGRLPEGPGVGVNDAPRQRVLLRVRLNLSDKSQGPGKEDGREKRSHPISHRYPPGIDVSHSFMSGR